jgi:D-beta-D-heptose 7-phosphate kinase / D-beta-D-heptose 1-phosphate adenosyltransferase
LLTPNRRELAAAAQMSVDGHAGVETAAMAIVRTCGVNAVLCTRGAEGMSLITRGDVHHLPAAAREVFDVSGAGDTVVATLSAGIAAGLPWPDAAQLANVAAGIVVGKVGTAVAYANDLIRSLRHDSADTSDDKVMSLAEAVDTVARWRRQGLTIGFTNGCFDLLHPGHISLMSQAKASSDRLVVGLNSDTSVKRLKGPDRPIQSEAARASVLASLASVDVVVVFNEDTPVELIEALRPDMLVKGPITGSAKW